jgi:hypothetical protein
MEVVVTCNNLEVKRARHSPHMYQDAKPNRSSNKVSHQFPECPLNLIIFRLHQLSSGTDMPNLRIDLDSLLCRYSLASHDSC